MLVPLEITFRDVPKTEKLEELIRQQAEKLDQHCDHLDSCRVAIEQPSQHAQTFRQLRVRLDMTVAPRHELVVTRDSAGGSTHDSVEALVRDAFHAARRQVQKLKEMQRGKTKTHPEQEVAAVVEKLFEDYGFLRTADDREIYFHKSSLLNAEFEALKIGSGVAFTVEMGDEGPQATSVRIIDGRGHSDHVAA